MYVAEESDQSDSDGPAAFTDDNKAWLKPAKLPLSNDDDDDDDLVRTCAFVMKLVVVISSSTKFVLVTYHLNPS